MLTLALAVAVWVLTWGSAGSYVGVGSALAADDYAVRRESMVREQILARGVSDANVLAALRAVPRHRFVPPSLAPQAYSDHPLPIGNGQTISQPYIVALMSELLDLRKSHKVLEIGTGCGYQAAVLSGLAGEVYSMEIVEELGVQARERLRTLGYGNVQVRIGNGYAGWPEQAPFDRIILTAAPEELPPALIDQLKPAGMLVAPVGPIYGNQELIVVTKDEQGKVRRSSVLPVRFVPMVQAPE
jgi:protein-L-isoaspartate(D-aspartate) O-methyltransferase